LVKRFPNAMQEEFAGKGFRSHSNLKNGRKQERCLAGRRTIGDHDCGKVSRPSLYLSGIFDFSTKLSAWRRMHSSGKERPLNSEK
jgi:hypothetical protein